MVTLKIGKFFWVKIWHSKCWCDLENKVKVTKIYSLLSNVSMVFLCKFGQNPPICLGDKSADKTHFYSLYSVVTLKLMSKSPKSNQIFQLSQGYNTCNLTGIHHLVQEIWCRQAFLDKIWHSKCWCDLENQFMVTKIYTLLSHVSVVFLFKYGQNPPINSGGRVQTRLIFTVFIM